MLGTCTTSLDRTTSFTVASIPKKYLVELTSRTRFLSRTSLYRKYYSLNSGYFISSSGKVARSPWNTNHSHDKVWRGRADFTNGWRKYYVETIYRRSLLPFSDEPGRILENNSFWRVLDRDSGSPSCYLKLVYPGSPWNFVTWSRIAEFEIPLFCLLQCVTSSHRRVTFVLNCVYEWPCYSPSRVVVGFAGSVSSASLRFSIPGRVLSTLEGWNEFISRRFLRRRMGRDWLSLFRSVGSVSSVSFRFFILSGFPGFGKLNESVWHYNFSILSQTKDGWRLTVTFWFYRINILFLLSILYICPVFRFFKVNPSNTGEGSPSG